MEENMLVLAKAYPVVSKSYDHLVCIAGLTDKGEWRRAYPLPWKVFWTYSENRFKKKSWIKYQIKENTPSDHRKESRKILYETVKPVKEANFADIKSILDAKVTTIESLEALGHKEASLGVIKPIITDFHEIDNNQYEIMTSMQKQLTLHGTSAVKIDIPEKKFAYKFRCNEQCKGHDMLCEDWEIGELYRKCKKMMKEGKYKDEQEVLQKVKEKMLSGMLKKKEVYFIVGTHNVWGTYMIIGIVYSTKEDEKNL